MNLKVVLKGFVSYISRLKRTTKFETRVKQIYDTILKFISGSIYFVRDRKEREGQKEETGG